MRNTHARASVASNNDEDGTQEIEKGPRRDNSDEQSYPKKVCTVDAHGGARTERGDRMTVELHQNSCGM